MTRTKPRLGIYRQSPHHNSKLIQMNTDAKLEASKVSENRRQLTRRAKPNPLKPSLKSCFLLYRLKKTTEKTKTKNNVNGSTLYKYAALSGQDTGK